MTMSNDKEAGADKKSPGTLPDDVAGEVDLFVKQNDSLAEMLPLSTLAMDEAAEASGRQFAEFLGDECTKIEQSTGKKTYNIDPGQYSHLMRLLRRTQKTELAQELVPRSLFVSLVSQFDAYLGRILRQLFKIRPEILTASANTLTFAQLVEFGSIENAREYIIDKEIESILRKSHSEQFDWLENKLGLPLRTNLPAWTLFIEITERRNLFVHTNGLVSHQYLEVCERHKCEVPSDVAPGKSLSISGEYFRAAYDCLFEIGIKLAQVLWRRVEPGKMASADASLNRVCYELLVEGRYRLARVLLDFGTETLKKHSSEESRLLLVVNRAQTYKWTGEHERSRAILDAEDWSAANLKFKLACAVLRDDHEVALQLMSQIGTDGEMNKHYYREWPLFKEIRKSSEFAAKFEEIFREPYTAIIVNE